MNLRRLLTLALRFLSAAALQAADPQNVTPDQAEKLLKEKKEAVVLDVRTADEFKDGHIPGAKNVDFLSPDFKQKMAELDKSKDYVVHCAAGGRSSKAVKLMEENKFGTIYHLNGGFNGWKAAGKPIEK